MTDDKTKAQIFQRVQRALILDPPKHLSKDNYMSMALSIKDRLQKGKFYLSNIARGTMSLLSGLSNKY